MILAIVFAFVFGWAAHYLAKEATRNLPDNRENPHWRRRDAEDGDVL